MLLTQYCSGDQIEKDEMGGECSTYGGEQKCVQGFGVETFRKELLGRPRRKWDDNIKMDLQDVAYEGTGWMDVAQDMNRWPALVTAVMNCLVP